MNHKTANAFRESYLEAQAYKKELNRRKLIKLYSYIPRIVKTILVFIFLLWSSTHFLNNNAVGLASVIFDLLPTGDSSLFFILPVLLVVFAGLIGVLSNRDTSKTSNSFIASARKRLSLLEEELASYKEHNDNLQGDLSKYLNKEHKKDLYDMIHESIKSNVVDDYIEDLTSRIKKNNSLARVEDYFVDIKDRLVQRSNSLNVTSRINLFIGISIATIGISILLYFVFNMSYLKQEGTLIFVELSSKACVSLAIELLSFFFLNLYKRNLQEIKYIQNEITNIEAKKVSLIMSAELPDKFKFKILDALSKTERNFILEKGQSTVDILQNKNDSTAVLNGMKIAFDYIKSKPSK
ncbi:hypothetical protein ABEG75_19405 [Pantoea agglomerans]|nr:hypothetical protein [Pantoea agglomerans]KEY40323.1 hypothetical protein FB99_45430 [Pantoea agglomerans]QAV47407.1 hypothetical protein D1629_22530 [Pantoea agglomerans]QAV52062.1 hypothetical protein D1628_22480 [Pantoea agglomerans]